MEKNVEFFNIIYEDFNMYQHTDNQNKRAKIFKDLIKDSLKTKEYMLKMYADDTEPSITLEIIEITDDFIFGILGKLNDLSNKSLLRLRGKGIEEIHKISDPKDLEYYIENFTYFYIRLEDLCCAVLQNSSAPSFKKHFLSLINEKIDYKNNFFDKVDILNRKESNINESIFRFNSIINLNMAFYNDNIAEKENLPRFNEMWGISQSSIEHTDINISFKSDVDKKKLEKRLSSYKSYDDYTKFKVTGINEDGVTQCIDLIESLLTQKVTINIEEKYLMSDDGEEKIKEALASALPII